LGILNVFRKKKEKYIDVEDLEQHQQEQAFLKAHKEKLKAEKKERIKKLVEGTSKVSKAVLAAGKGLEKGLREASKNLPKSSPKYKSKSKSSPKYIIRNNQAFEIASAPKTRKISRRYIKKESVSNNMFDLGNSGGNFALGTMGVSPDIGSMGMHPDFFSGGKKSKSMKIKKFKYF